MRSAFLLTSFVLAICPAAVFAQQSIPKLAPEFAQRRLLVAPENARSARLLPPAGISIEEPLSSLSLSDNTCLTMHTIFVRRVPGSDLTQRYGQRTCTPNSKFQVKQTMPSEEKSR